ncbi:MAG: ORF6N domain-containing protein [Spiribacter sp.]|nr:ORF6N domain-containing protein [Spiribacter sp.]MDR9488845.1 ORF6N domain-containing protein [Spiribacter sp.]
MSNQPFHYQGQAVLTLRQIDRMNGVIKGSAFRAFKRVADTLIEGEDYFVLAMDELKTRSADPALNALHAAMLSADALYPSSRVVVLITQTAYARLQRAANLSSS